MNIRDIRDWLLFGYKPGKNKSSTHWWGMSFGIDTIRGRVMYRLINGAYELTGAPSRFRFRLADWLAMASMKLRGEKPCKFGWYCDERGNRAAEIVDSVQTDLVLATDLDDEDSVEYMHRIGASVRELATLAKAVSWMDYKKAEEETLS